MTDAPADRTRRGIKKNPPIHEERFMFQGTKALLIAFVAAIMAPGLTAPGAHRPETLGNQAVTVTELKRSANAFARIDELIPFLPIDRGEIIDPDEPIGYEIVDTAVAQVLVPAVTR